MLNFLHYHCNTTFHLLWSLDIMFTSVCQTQRTTRINPTLYMAVKIAVEACKIGSACAEFCFRKNVAFAFLYLHISFVLNHNLLINHEFLQNK